MIRRALGIFVRWSMAAAFGAVAGFVALFTLGPAGAVVACGAAVLAWALLAFALVAWALLAGIADATFPPAAPRLRVVRRPRRFEVAP